MDIAHPLSPLGHVCSPHTLPRFHSSSKCLPPPELDNGDCFLAIDDLLDFSNEDIGGPIESCLSNATSSLAAIPSEVKLGSSPTDKKPPQQAPSVFDSNELCVPCDDLAELEWLSNFVEESFSSADVPASFAFGSNGGFVGKEEKSHRGSINEPFQSTSPVSVLESSGHSREKLGSTLSFSPEMSVPGRARSKRCRTAVCFWNTRILSAEASESFLESSSTTSTITAASSDSDMFTTYYDHHVNDDDHHHHHQHKRVDDSFPKVKKFCKLYDSFSNTKLKKIKLQDATPPVRTCLHCGAQKTPQWRAGPMGPKTLCNACGVRYKSGRLCPEYRPAASPTFSETVHSNSHRRVLEMRRQKGELISPNSHSHSHEQHENQLYRGGNGDGSGDDSLSAED